MSIAEGIHLFTLLPKVERAKLISDLVHIELPPGQLYRLQAENEMLSFVKEGRVEVGTLVQEQWIGLVTLGTGEVLGYGFDPKDQSQLAFRSTTGAELVQLPKARFESLLNENPHVLQRFYGSLTLRNERIIQELARSKVMLMAYASELWQSVDEESSMALNDSAATVFSTVQMPDVTRVRDEPAMRLKRGHVPLLLTAVLGVLAGWLAYRGGFALPAAEGLGILVWAVANWVLDTLPDHVVALTVAGVTSVLAIVPTEVAFSGFANKTWVLLLAVLGMAQAVSKTGLLYRAALYMLRKLPPTYGGQSTALSLLGLVMAPFLPGVTGRQTMASRLAMELSEAMRFKSNSPGSAGLAMACFLAGSCLYFISMTGASANLVVFSYMPETVKLTFTWGRWLLAALPPTLIVFVLSTVALKWLFRPESGHEVSRHLVERQVSILGPMSHPEKVTLWSVGLLVISFIMQPLVSLDPTWVGLGGFLVLISTGILGKDDLRKGIDWPFLLLTGSLLGVAATTEKIGLIKALSTLVTPIVAASGSHHTWVIILIVALLTTLVRVFIPIHSAILLMVMALTPVAIALGYNPMVFGLVVLIMSSHFFVPQGNPTYLAAHAGGDQRAFTHKQVRPFALLHVGITLLATLASIPYWKWIGLIP